MKYFGICVMLFWLLLLCFFYLLCIFFWNYGDIGLEEEYCIGRIKYDIKENVR